MSNLIGFEVLYFVIFRLKRRLSNVDGVVTKYADYVWSV